MTDASTLSARRRALQARIQRPILLLGNGDRARNLPMTLLPFRQDSTFLYVCGCALPDAALLLDEHGSTLFLPDLPEDDELWHGPAPSREALRDELGIDHLVSLSELHDRVSDRPLATLAVADEEKNQLLTRLTGRPHRFGRSFGDLELVDAVIALRRTKSEPEIAEMELAAARTEQAFSAVMASTHPGTSEQELVALLKAVLAARGCTTGYDPILTVRGEILHNHSYHNTLQAGQLLLLDAGAEVPSGYGVDVTRTWPVSGSFDPRQRAVYEAVLASQRAAIDRCRPEVRYREVHDTACRVLIDFLRDEGLLRCSADEAIDTGAHGVFYPHGTGHHLGLDVHDLENFGDRSSYPQGASRPKAFGTRNLRLDLPLQPGWVVTVEPGFYIVPAILQRPELREELGRRVDWERAEEWIGFGGVRIEDDILITSTTPRNLTEAIAKEPDTLCELVGAGPTVRQRLA